MTSVVGYITFGEFNTAWQAEDVAQVSKDETQSLFVSYPQVMDWAGVSVYIALVMFMTISAFLIRINPVFLPVAFVLLLVLLFLPMIISNIWEEFITDDSLSFNREIYAKTDFVLSNYAVLWVVSLGLALGAGFIGGRVSGF